MGSIHSQKSEAPASAGFQIKAATSLPLLLHLSVFVSHHLGSQLIKKVEVGEHARCAGLISNCSSTSWWELPGLGIGGEAIPGIPTA